MAKRLRGSSRQVRRARVEPADPESDARLNTIGRAVTTILPQKRRFEEQKDADERVRLMLSGMQSLRHLIVELTLLCVGMSDENIRLLQGDHVPHNIEPSGGQGGGQIIDVNYDPDGDNGWEDLPDPMQEDDAFVHALRDITDNK